MCCPVEVKGVGPGTSVYLEGKQGKGYDYLRVSAQGGEEALECLSCGHWEAGSSWNLWDGRWAEGVRNAR